MSKYRDIRRTVFRILDAESRGSTVERAGNVVLMSFIFLNVLAVILETVRPVSERFGEFFAEFEAISVAVFSVEYALRVWTCVEVERFARPVVGRLRFVASPLALVDAAAIVPAYLPGDVFLDLRFARIVRLVRLMRVFKVARYSETLRSFGSVARRKGAELGLIVFFLSVLVVLSASAMYFVEHPSQPKVFSSIPAAMWWAVATLTTVGYGDIYPVTPVGKFLGSIIALLGIGFFCAARRHLGSRIRRGTGEAEGAECGDVPALRPRHQ